MTRNFLNLNKDLFAFSVLVDAGSRHEVDYPSGITHMLEKMAFQVK